jgi:hypothetical protein
VRWKDSHKLVAYQSVMNWARVRGRGRETLLKLADAVRYGAEVERAVAPVLI